MPSASIPTERSPAPPAGAPMARPSRSPAGWRAPASASPLPDFVQANRTIIMSETIVVLDPMAPERADKLRALLPPGFVLTHGTARGDDHMKEIIAEAEYAIAGQVGVNAEVLKAAKKLKLLHKWGVGVDNLDTQTAKQLGIKVARTTGSNAVPVAEFTLGLALAALRCI